MSPTSSSQSQSPSPDTIISQWRGVIDNDFSKTIKQTFNLPANDDGYIYRSESFAMPLSKIQELIDGGTLKYHYRGSEGIIEVPSTDIDAYTSIFSSTTDTAKALKSFSANAKKHSPRAQVASYLQLKRLFPDPPPPDLATSLKAPSKRKTAFPNPYHDLWVWSCHETGFVGPLPDPHYAHPSAARQTHPAVPVLYHHFGCACPSFEALSVISQLASTPSTNGILDMGSGNGYWTYLLRGAPFSAHVVAVDNGSSGYRYSWIGDTRRAGDGVDYLRRHGGCAALVLLLVYPVTGGGRFTERAIRAYTGDTVAVVGTLNANRFTGFDDSTVEAWFEREMKAWRLLVRLPLPSFAGKDEGLCVWRRTKEGEGLDR